MKECKIIENLLPNYIEKLTDKETNQYIENHLKECEGCKLIFQNMEQEIKTEESKIDNREIKYMKKFRNKVRILIATIVIIIITLSILTTRTMQNMNIIADLAKKAQKYENYKNIHLTMSTYYYDTGDYTKIEIYRLYDKVKIITSKTTEEGKIIKVGFSNKKNSESEEIGGEYQMNLYKESPNKNIVAYNQEVTIPIYSHQYSIFKFQINNDEYWRSLFKIAKSSKIEKTTFNGKEAYYISNLLNGIYIDNETGLLLHENDKEYISTDTGEVKRSGIVEYRYEFDVVKEKDFIEPNTNGYEIVKTIQDGII